MHEGRFSIEIADDGAFVFRGPDGRRLPESGRLDRRTLEALAEAAARGGLTLRELNRREGLSIDADTARCQWTGERMDYHFAVGLLCDRSDEARRKAREGGAAHGPI